MAKKENNRISSKGKTKSAKATQETIELSFYSPGATNVFVAGEFNGWDTNSLPMKRDKDGIWKAKLNLLPGRYEYKLFADGGWVEDLPDAETASNPFGTKNFIVSVK
jgi:1,4-alpha-glucan branching enzyme